MSAEQLTLDVEPRKRARRRDPATSKSSAHGDRTAHAIRILAALAGFGDMTYIQISETSGVERHECARRIAELGEQRFIADAELGGRKVTALTPSGRQAQVYRITDTGLRALRQARANN